MSKDNAIRAMINNKPHTLVVLEVIEWDPDSSARVVRLLKPGESARVDTPQPKQFWTAFVPDDMLKPRRD